MCLFVWLFVCLFATDDDKDVEDDNTSDVVDDGGDGDGDDDDNDYQQDDDVDDDDSDASATQECLVVLVHPAKHMLGEQCRICSIRRHCC